MRFVRTSDGAIAMVTEDQGAETWTLLTRSTEDTLFELLLRRRQDREPAGPSGEPELITGDAD